MINLVVALLLSLLQTSVTGLEGSWQGTLVAGPTQLRVVFNITRSADGIFLGNLVSLDQGAIRIPIDRVELTGDSVRFEVRAVNGVFNGMLNGDQLQGTWAQGGQPLPLALTRGPAPANAPAPAPAAAPTTPPPFGIPLEMLIPVPPTPVAADGKTHLVYELHMTNFAGVEVLLQKLEVLNGSTVMATYEGGELNALLQRPGIPPADDRRGVGPGLRAIAYLWITLEAGTPVPQTLRHRITGRTTSLEGGVVRVSASRPVMLGPPLRGADWIAFNGPGNASIHRRALLPLDGKTPIAQRFAIDWVQVGEDRRTFTGAQGENRNYRAYGAEILAVADGVVSAIKDGIPENVPGLTSRAVPITPETVGGNYVVLDLGNGNFAFYAHMQPGSLRVKVGDRVRRGQVLGLVGNSGNSTEPHLHFHVSDSNSPIGSEGLPYVLESFEVQVGQGTWTRHQNEMPLLNVRVRF